MSELASTPIGAWLGRRISRAGLIWLWVLTTAAAAAAMSLGVNWWAAIFIVTIPFVIFAAFAPTIWLYLTAFLLPLLWRWSGAGALAGLGMAVLLGTGAPLLMNWQMDRQIDAALRSDFGSRIAIDKLGTVALLTNWDAAFCGFDCSRLLASDRAAAVLIGPAVGGPLDPDMKMLRVALAPRGDGACVIPRSADGELPIYAGFLERVFGPDRCPTFSTVSLGSADWVFAERPENVRDPNRTWPVPPVQLRQHTVFVREGGGIKRVMQKSTADGFRVATPLTLVPLQGADTSTSAHWGHSAPVAVGRRLDAALENFIDRIPYVASFDAPR